MYPIINVPANACDLPEQLGSKPKFWFEHVDGRAMLFKECRPDSGEDWAEKVCCEIARGLELPHAEYDLAVWRGKRGVVSPTFVPNGGRLVLGNEVLGRVIKGYGAATRYQARQHTIRSVMSILTVPGVKFPLGYTTPPALQRARDLFVGYLMLDVLVSNQDRHHQNWGFVLTSNQEVTFAPTFDHASSLGRNEQDEERIRRLTTRDRNSSVEAYVTRARSALYGTPPGAKPLTTMEAFQEAARLSPMASQYWLARLDAVPVTDFEAIFRAVPQTEITRPASDFALRILEINRARLIALRAT